MFVLFSVSLGCRKDGLRVMWLCGRYRRFDVSRAVYCVGGGGSCAALAGAVVHG